MNHILSLSSRVEVGWCLLALKSPQQVGVTICCLWISKGCSLSYYENDIKKKVADLRAWKNRTWIVYISSVSSALSVYLIDCLNCIGIARFAL